MKGLYRKAALSMIFVLFLFVSMTESLASEEVSICEVSLGKEFAEHRDLVKEFVRRLLEIHSHLDASVAEAIISGKAGSLFRVSEAQNNLKILDSSSQMFVTALQKLFEMLNPEAQKEFLVILTEVFQKWQVHQETQKQEIQQRLDKAQPHSIKWGEILAGIIVHSGCFNMSYNPQDQILRVCNLNMNYNFENQNGVFVSSRWLAAGDGVFAQGDRSRFVSNFFAHLETKGFWNRIILYDKTGQGQILSFTDNLWHRKQISISGIWIKSDSVQPKEARILSSEGGNFYHVYKYFFNGDSGQQIARIRALNRWKSFLSYIPPWGSRIEYKNTSIQESFSPSGRYVTFYQPLLRSVRVYDLETHKEFFFKAERSSTIDIERLDFSSFAFEKAIYFSEDEKKIYWPAPRSKGGFDFYESSLVDIKLPAKKMFSYTAPIIEETSGPILLWHPDGIFVDGHFSSNWTVSNMKTGIWQALGTLVGGRAILSPRNDYLFLWSSSDRNLRAIPISQLWDATGGK